MRQNRPNYGRDSVCHLHCRSIVYGHVSKQWSERYCVGNCYKERDVPLFMCDKTGGCIGYGVFVGSQVIRLCSMHLLMFLFWRSYLRWLGVSRFDIVRNVADRFCSHLKTFLFFISGSQWGIVIHNNLFGYRKNVTSISNWIKSFQTCRKNI